MINPFRSPAPAPAKSVDPQKLRDMVARIDARYDAMLYDGISAREALYIEGLRDQEHRRVQQAAFELALDGFK